MLLYQYFLKQLLYYSHNFIIYNSKCNYSIELLSAVRGRSNFSIKQNTNTLFILILIHPLFYFFNIAMVQPKRPNNDNEADTDDMLTALRRQLQPHLVMALQSHATMNYPGIQVHIHISYYEYFI